MITVYVYRQDDGVTQVRCTDTDDFELVIDMLNEAIRAMEDGEPVRTM
jgi:hypothetical protein